VLDSGCTNHMIREKKMFTSFEKNDTTSDSITFEIVAKARLLAMVKLLSQSNILFLKFFLLDHWTTICCTYHNFVRWAIIVSSLIRV
jgi:hypothetical protein